MAEETYRPYRRGIHPVHALLLASALPLFLGTVLSDWAYASSYEVQWTNFASWLNAGALVFTGFALVWALIDALRADADRRRGWLLVGLLAATFVVGFISALVHAKDAWAAMPTALILSVIVLLLVLASIWVGFATLRTGGRP